MSIFEYNQKEEEELLRREEYEAGAEMERKNTEKERKRADLAEQEILRLQEKLALLQSK